MSDEARIYDLECQIDQLRRAAQTLRLERDAYRKYVDTISELKADFLMTQPLPKFVRTKDGIDVQIIERVDPRSDSYSALMWDCITNAHRYTPRPGDKVLDLGAHYGMFALYAAARGAEVDAFEPQRIAYHELCHTAEVAGEIGFGSIHPFQRAVWSDHRVIELRKKGSTATASAMRSDGELVERVLAEAFDELLFQTYQCVKMDIEGAEWELLTKSKLLGNIGFLTVEIHNDILGPEKCEEIRLILEKEFRHINRLPNKNKPSETVAYFCRR